MTKQEAAEQSSQPSSKSQTADCRREWIAVANGRRTIYSWLSNFLIAQPTSRWLKSVLEESLVNSLSAVFSDRQSNASLTAIVSALTQRNVDELRSEFESLFVVPIYGTYTPPYESCFREKYGETYGNLWGNAAEELSRLYLMAGFGIEYPPHIFAPDHLGLELAFMSKLCAEELEALRCDDDKKISETRRSQQLCLEHIRAWVSDFALAVKSCAPASMYSHVVVLVDLFTRQDYGLINMTASQNMPDRR